MSTRRRYIHFLLLSHSLRENITYKKHEKIVEWKQHLYTMGMTYIYRSQHRVRRCMVSFPYSVSKFATTYLACVANTLGFDESPYKGGTSSIFIHNIDSCPVREEPPDLFDGYFVRFENKCVQQFLGRVPFSLFHDGCPRPLVLIHFGCVLSSSVGFIHNVHLETTEEEEKKKMGGDQFIYVYSIPLTYRLNPTNVKICMSSPRYFIQFAKRNKEGACEKRIQPRRVEEVEESKREDETSFFLLTGFT